MKCCTFSSRIFVMGWVMLLILAGGCQRPEEAKTTTPELVSKKIIVTVNGDPVYEGDIMRRIHAAYGNIDKSQLQGDRWQMVVEMATEEEIQDKLLLAAANQEGITISQKEIDAALANTKKMLGEDEFTKMLTARQATEQEYRQFLEKRSLIERFKEQKIFAEITIDEDKLQEYYEGHGADFVPAQVRLEILRFDEEHKAAEAYERLKKGEEFEALVAELSAGRQRKVGNRTRWMPIDAVPEALRPLVASAKPGEINGPVESDDGYYVFSVLEQKEAGVVPFEEVKEEIKNGLLARKKNMLLSQWYESNKNKANIEYIRQ